MRHIDHFNREHRNGQTPTAARSGSESTSGEPDRIVLRLYSSAIARATTRTSDAVFVEEYLYGRGREFKSGTPLGREVPIVEYRLRTEEGQNPQKNPQDILLATFGVIWNSYSIDAAIYSPLNEESEFMKNLERLREELGAHLQPILIAAGLDNSVLRAGYTSMWGAKATVIASLVVNGKCGRLRADPGRSKLADLRAVTPKAVASCQLRGIGREDVGRASGPASVDLRGYGRKVGARPRPDLLSGLTPSGLS